MLKLTGYMDETGHSKDEKQRFVGMAGLVAPTENWPTFERKWKQTLKDFQIPYFHMKDFANLRSFFEGWSEQKRRKLFGKLMRIMATTNACPVGSITSVEDYRSLPQEDREIVLEPYLFSFLGCIYIPTSFIKETRDDLTLALVFAEQAEFKASAEEMFAIVKLEYDFGVRLDSPEFRDMKAVVPLQAADIVAYEFYKEVERRRYRPEHKPRYGYEELVKMALRANQMNAFFFCTKKTLVDFPKTSGKGVFAGKQV